MLQVQILLYLGGIFNHHQQAGLLHQNSLNLLPETPGNTD